MATLKFRFQTLTPEPWDQNPKEVFPNLSHAARIEAAASMLLSSAEASGPFQGHTLVVYMTGRIVLSHVHVSTLRRTRSTEKLITTGLASGGIITLE